MKPSFHSSSSALALLLGTLALIGCGGAASFSNPGSSGVTTATPPNFVPGPPVNGSVYGGHAPIVGSHVYLLQPGTSGYGSIATSILGNNGATSANGYTISSNTSDPNIPIGWKYVTTDSNGDISLTGAYNCAAGQPVYTYSYGGNATGGNPVTANNSGIVELAILGNCPTTGQTNFGNGSSDQITFIYANEVSTVAAAYVFQPFTVQATTSGASSAIYVGSSGTTQALLGIANAATNAAQLYDIQGGGGQSSVYDGEGHVANYRTADYKQVGGISVLTPNIGNGVVPQATIDTLANILAACVDNTGSTSTPCSTLFTNATETGDSAGVAPTDIARAAMNIARYPAGNYSTTHTPTNFVANIFGIPTSTVPYTPNLGTHQPNDFTIAINYPYTQVGGYGTANPDVERAESVAVDGNGEIWITAQAGGDGSTSPSPSADRWTPIGTLDSPNPSPKDYIFGYVSADSSNNAWTGSAADTTGIYYANNNGAFSTTYGSGYSDAYTVITNPVGDAFFFAKGPGTGTNYGMWEYAPGGTLVAGSPFNISTTTTTGPGPVTQNLTITAASETNSGGTYTYTFNYAYAGGTPPTLLAVGDTVPLTLANDPGTGAHPTAATGWPGLTSVTVASVSGTSFTATGTTATTNSNDGNGAATTAAINITAATETNPGGFNPTYTYTFDFTNVGTPGVPLAVGDIVPVTLTNDPGTGTTPVHATGWNNLTTVTVATVNSATNPTSFTATGKTATTNTVSTNTNGPTEAVTITGATETHTGGTYTYTFNYTLPAGSPALAVGDVVPLALTNDPGTGTPKVAATGWQNLTSVTVASVTGTTTFTATGTIPTTNSSGTATAAINITAATVVRSGPAGHRVYTYTFTYNTVGTPTALAAGDTVALNLTNASGGFGGTAATGWGNLTSVTVAAGPDATTFTASGTTATTDSADFFGDPGNGATGTGTYPYSASGNGATGTGTLQINGATGTGSFTYTNANGATGTGSYTYTGTVTTTTPGAIPAGDNVAHGAIGADGHFWLTTEAGDTIAKVGPTGTTDFTSIVAPGQPEFPAIDNSGNAWIPLQAAAGPIYHVTPAGTATTLTSASTGANFLFPFGSAVDGNGNVWITNRCGPATTSTSFNNCVNTVPTGYYSTLVEINGSNNLAISPPANYVPEAQYGTATTLTRVMIDPLNIAIDPSGNLWITNYAGNITGGGQVVEIIGIAAPVVTPLSLAAGSNSLGAKP